MVNQDIRWQQRNSNFNKALIRLKKFVDAPSLNEMEEQGLIKAFEYTYELSWKTIKDLFEYQGESNILGARDAFRLAFSRGLINEGETWMQMIVDRNNTSHTYDEETAREIINNVLGKYYTLFNELALALEKQKEK